MTIRLYVEGGGDSRALHVKCREGFGKFLEAAGFKGRMPRIVASGSRNQAYEDFKTALKQPDGGSCVLLLVDSEGPVAQGLGPWKYVENRQRGNWIRPADATDDQLHFMVQCMESWFLADRDALKKYFGQGFQDTAIPNRRDVENVPKPDVFQFLQNATRACAPKGAYSKGRHSFAVLASVNPSLVKESAPYARRFLDTLDRATG